MAPQPPPPSRHLLRACLVARPYEAATHTVCERAVQQALLCLTTWCSQTRTLAILPHCAAAQIESSGCDRIVGVADDRHAASFTTGVAVSAFVEREATTRDRGHTRHCHQRAKRRREHHIDTTDDGRTAFRQLDRTKCSMASHKAGGARGVHGRAWSLHTEHERHTADHDGRCICRESVNAASLATTDQHSFIVTRPGTNEDALVTAEQRRPALTALVQRNVAVLQQETLKRVLMLRL